MPRQWPRRSWPDAGAISGSPFPCASCRATRSPRLRRAATWSPSRRRRPPPRQRTSKAPAEVADRGDGFVMLVRGEADRSRAGRDRQRLDGRNIAGTRMRARDDHRPIDEQLGVVAASTPAVSRPAIGHPRTAGGCRLRPRRSGPSCWPRRDRRAVRQAACRPRQLLQGREDGKRRAGEDHESSAVERGCGAWGCRLDDAAAQALCRASAARGPGSKPARGRPRGASAIEPPVRPKPRKAIRSGRGGRCVAGPALAGTIRTTGCHRAAAGPCAVRQRAARCPRRPGSRRTAPGAARPCGGRHAAFLPQDATAPRTARSSAKSVSNGAVV